MLLVRCLILSSAVLQAQVLLYQPESFQFVDIGSTARIPCVSTERVSSGIPFSWYKRRENEISVLVQECSDNHSNTNGGAKFVCRVEQKQKLILEISDVDTQDSGLYFCATKNSGFFFFSNGFSLIVGDSYTRSTRVILLLPPTHLLHADRVACVVHGVSNLVQVSWDFSGELQQDGLTLMVKNSSASFTFASVLRLPRDWQRGGKNFTCEVRFNSSGPTVKKSAIFPAPFSVASEEKCLSYVVSTAVVGTLALLALLLTFLWIQFCPSRLGFQLKVNESPSSEVLEEGTCYAQLDFPSRSCDRNNKRKQGSQWGNLKI